MTLARAVLTIAVAAGAGGAARDGRHGAVPRRRARHGGGHGRAGAVVRAAHPPDVLAGGAPRGAARSGCRACPMRRRSRSLRSATSSSCSAYVSLENVGIYSMAVSFGLVQKLFLSAFESAWAPFYFATIREPDAPRVFRTITTYGIAVLALLTAGIVGGRTARGGGDDAWLSHGARRSAVERRRHRHRLHCARRLSSGRLPADVDRPQYHQADAVLPGRDDQRGRDQHRAEPVPDSRHTAWSAPRGRMAPGTRSRRRSALRSRSGSIPSRTNGAASRASASRASPPTARR